MPATSEKQAHTARMALAFKHGHLKLRAIPAGARKAVLAMAKMAESSLQDFTHMPKRPQPQSLL